MMTVKLSNGLEIPQIGVGFQTPLTLSMWGENLTIV